MPSIGDIANEAKALLEDIQTNTLGTRNNTATIINQMNQLDARVAQVDGHIVQLNNTNQAGFTNLAQALGIMIQLQLQNNQLLAGNNAQNETIICWLEKSANVLCEIKHNTDSEVRLQKEISATLTHIDDVLELVHAREAMDLLNRDALKQRLDECCPVEEIPIEPCFDDCKEPRPVRFDPLKFDWNPIHYEREEPIG